MIYDYRVIKEQGNTGRVSYRIAEVYYESSGEISGWCDTASSCLIWYSYDDLKRAAAKIQAAFNKPVLLKLENDTLVEIQDDNDK